MGSWVELLKEQAKIKGIVLSDEHLRLFAKHMEILLDYNGKMNLTAIKEPEQIAIKHYLDSLSILTHVDIPQEAKLIDIGTGAGFPGVSLKIVRPDIKLTLLDSQKKKADFLKLLTNDLGLQAEIIHGRAEELGKLPEYREVFDVVTARSVANLTQLAELCIPYIRVGGSFIAMKGTDMEEYSPETVKILGGEISDMYNFELYKETYRQLIIIKKISQTSPQFPRKFAKISKKQPG